MVAICGVNSRRTGGQVDVVQCLERVAGRDRLCCQATWLTPRSALRTSSTPSCMPLPSVVLTAVVVAAAAESTAHHRCPATQQKCIVRRRRLANDGMLPMRRFVWRIDRTAPYRDCVRLLQFIERSINATNLQVSRFYAARHSMSADSDLYFTKNYYYYYLLLLLLLLFFFFRSLISALTERTQPYPATWSEVSVVSKRMSKIWGIPSPANPGFKNHDFERIRNLTATSTAYIFGMKHGIHKRANALQTTRGLIHRHKTT